MDTLLLEQVTALFKQSTPTYLGQIRYAIMERDSLALEKCVHTLLGSFGMFGAHRAREIAMTLQAAAQSQNFEEAERLLTELDHETGRIYAAIAAGS